MRYLIACMAFFLSLLSSYFAEEEIPSPDRVIEMVMRDGVKLPANVYLPQESKLHTFPCVLVRHPLGKDRVSPYWLQLLHDGYALVVQSTRACCDERGESLPYVSDGWSDDHRPSDGYDSVQWVAQADFCDGNVSTVGSSATGITQLLLAPSSPPNLRCQYIEMAPPSMYQYAIYPGGQLKKEQVEGWLQIHKRSPSVLEWLKKHPQYDDFWERFNVLDYADQIRVPQVHLGGWYDIFIQGTIDSFFAVQQHSHPEVRNKHKLIIGPWGHRWRVSGKLGDFTLSPEQKRPPIDISYSSWMEYHVKHTKNDVESAPPVQYYVMGPFDGSASKGNCWRSANTWPPQGAEYQRFYFGLQNQLVTVCGDRDPAPVIFKRGDPVPTLGGRNLFLPDGPRDLQGLIKRKDVLSFMTDTLREDVEVTGRLWANLYINEVEKERDVCLRLVDIYPSGEAYLIAEGVSHLFPRETSEKSGPRLVITDLWSTSMVFARGHRIGLLISASNYPSYDLSFGQNEKEGTAFSLFATHEFPSSLALPVMSVKD